MELRIADTFADSLARLSGDEQKAVKTTAFDLQLNPASPGMRFHKLDKARDHRFWSIRVNDDIRLIVHKTESSLMLCYVDHHDKAYQWAERRKLEVHPKTGAAQLVEIRETVQEITIPKYVEREEVRTALPAAPKPPLFAALSDEDLFSYGVPSEWLADVRKANEDSLLELTDHLPSEAAEALLELATGGTPAVQRPAATGDDPFAHPDAQRRFRVMKDIEELARALEYPWEKWTIFLHPSQRELVERDYNGPARVAGSAGTGKTVVALHRAVFLARSNPDARVLLTTFSDTLANALRTKLRRLIGNEPMLAERIDVYAIDALGRRFYEAQFGRPRIASQDAVRSLLSESAAQSPDNKFSARFLLTEWEEVVDAWQLQSWEAYRDVQRLGRKTRLPEPQRAVLWSIFDRVRERLKAQGLITHPELFRLLTNQVAEREQAPFDFAVVDEAQDISIAQLRFLGALRQDRANALFFAGDLGQRIFRQPFSWKVLGVDVRGRSRVLQVNYRTSHQIRAQADRLLDPELGDVDGIREQRNRTVSVYNGPLPAIRVFDSVEDEEKAVGEWLSDRAKQGVVPHEMAVFVRSEAELNRAQAALAFTRLSYKVLDHNVETASGHVSISTMHRAKGLEFRAVVVMACDDSIIPLQERIETVTDSADLEEVYNTERHLLYVACTRARDHLFVTGVEPSSEFLDDLRG